MMVASPIARQTIVRELPADLDTPISVYLKLRGHGPSFLLESVEGGERIARYSFIGVSPNASYTVSGNKVIKECSGARTEIALEPGTDITHYLQSEMAPFQTNPTAGLPRFIGGLVGFLGFETVRHFEPARSADEDQ
jgi:anthranilate synthase component 1